MANRKKANKERKCFCHRDFGCMNYNCRNRRNIVESKNRVCKKTIKRGYGKDRIGEGRYTKKDYSRGTARW